MFYGNIINKITFYDMVKEECVLYYFCFKFFPSLFRETVTILS